MTAPVDVALPAAEPAERPPVRSVRRGMGYAAVSFAITAVAGMASAIATSRVYGVDHIGQYALVIAPWLLLIQFSSVSEQKALTKILAGMEARDRMVTGLFVPVLCFSFGLTALAGIPVAAISIGALHGAVHQPQLTMPVLVVIAGYIVIDNTSWNLDAVFSSFLAGRELFWARLVEVLSFPMFALALHPWMPTIWGLTLGTVLSFAAAFVLRLVLVRRYMRLVVAPRHVRAGFRRLPEMLGFGVRLVPAKFATGFMSQADVWLLGVTSTVTQVGAYARASGLATRMNDAGYRVSEILFPSLCERYDREGAAACRPLVERVARATALAMFGAAAVGGAVAPGLLQVFGHGFSRAAPALALLMVAYALSVLVLVEGQVLLAVGKPGTTSIVSVVRAIVAVACMIPLGAAFGGTGVAGALVVGQLTGWIFQTERMGPLLEWSVWRRLVQFGSTIAVTTGGGYVAGRVAYAAGERAGGVLLGLATGGAASALAFLAIAFVTRWLQPDLLRQARRMLRRSAARA